MSPIIKFKPPKLQTYKPKEKIEINKEATLPWLSYAGKVLMWFGGAVWLVVSGIFLSIKGFFFAEKRFKKIRSKYEKTADFTPDGQKKERFRMKIE